MLSNDVKCYLMISEKILYKKEIEEIAEFEKIAEIIIRKLVFKFNQIYLKSVEIPRKYSGLLQFSACFIVIVYFF